MRIMFYARGVMLALGALGLVNQANAQYSNYGAPSLLPTSQATRMEPAVQTSGYRTAESGYSVVGQTGYNGQANPYRSTSYAGQNNSNINYYSAPQPSSTGSEGVASPSDQPPVTSPWDGTANCTSGACNQWGAPCYVPSFPSACGNWYGNVGGLVMTRDRGNAHGLTVDSANPYSHLLTTNSAPVDWYGGYQFTVGRYFNCGWNAIEATYWTTYPLCTSANAYDSQVTGDLNSMVPFNGLTYDRGTGQVPVLSGYDGATRHMVTTQDTFRNFEVNMLGFGIGAFNPCGSGNGGGGCNPGCCDTWGPGGPGFSCNGCNNLRFAWVAGVRYFRWSNETTFCSDLTDVDFTGDPNEVYYRIQLVNSLVGYQVGGRFDYNLGQRLTAYTTTKFGIYANQVSQYQTVFNSMGMATVNSVGSPYNGMAYEVTSNSTRCSFLGEIDLGLAYRFTRCWSANMGYRVVGVTGVAMTDAQIPQDFTDLGAVQNIDTNGSMVMHGAYAGLSYNW